MKTKTKNEKRDRSVFSLFTENKNLKTRTLELEKKNKELEDVIDFFGVWKTKKVLEV